MSKGPDWARTGTIVAYAEWLRKKSDAFAVVVIRRDDAALAVHPEIPPRDAQSLVEDRIGDLAVAAGKARRGARKDARTELTPWRE